MCDENPVQKIKIKDLVRSSNFARCYQHMDQILPTNIGYPGESVNLLGEPLGKPLGEAKLPWVLISVVCTCLLVASKAGKFDKHLGKALQSYRVLPRPL